MWDWDLIPVQYMSQKLMLKYVKVVWNYRTNIRTVVWTVVVGILYRYIRHTTTLDFHGVGTNTHMKIVLIGYSGL